MHTRALHHAARALQAAGLATLRLNFRGVGRSTGTHDGGPGEQEDVRLALDHLARLHPQAELLVLGFSFGAWVGFRVAVMEPRVQGVIGLAVPWDTYDMRFLESYDRPKLLVHGGRDELASVGSCRRAYERLLPPRALCVLEDAGHLLDTHLTPLRRILVQRLQGWPPQGVARIKG